MVIRSDTPVHLYYLRWSKLFTVFPEQFGMEDLIKDSVRFSTYYSSCLLSVVLLQLSVVHRYSQKCCRIPSCYYLHQHCYFLSFFLPPHYQMGINDKNHSITFYINEHNN